MFRSSPPKVFSKKGTAQIQSEPTVEKTRGSATPTKPLCNFIETTLMQGCAPENPHHTCKTPLHGRTPPVCQKSFLSLVIFAVDKSLITTTPRP